MLAKSLGREILRKVDQRFKGLGLSELEGLVHECQHVRSRQVVAICLVLGELLEEKAAQA